MSDYKSLSKNELEALGKISTPSVCNAVETFKLQARTEGFIKEDIHPFFPELGIMVGYAVTARASAASPPTPDQAALRYELMNLLLALPEPRIIVIEDIDSPDCLGAFWGEVQTNIHRRLGCIGSVTNGGVRDLDEVRAMKFQLFAKRAIPSHAYVHLVDVGKPVTIGGLTVNTGDIIHGDQHGVTRIPIEVAREIPAATKRIEDKEQEVIRYCRSSEFSVEGLKRLQKQG
ncbi:MAG: RraA family protein [Thermodesulfobacteriota bacterium]